MIIDYSFNNIQNVVNDFFNATSVNIAILDGDFNMLYINAKNSNKYCLNIQSTNKGISLCHCSDIELLKKCKESKKIQQHVCHAGLMDIAIPILHDYEIIGFIIMGQIKFDENFEASNIKTTDICIEQLKKDYNDLPLFDKERIESVIKVAVIVAKYLLLEKIIKPKRSINLENVVKFIKENLGEDLSVNSISRKTYISKSTIYTLFRKYFNMTVSEYVNMQRINKAVELLRTTELSIENISSMVGYSTSSYFSKIFKKIKKISPKQYKGE